MSYSARPHPSQPDSFIALESKAVTADFRKYTGWLPSDPQIYDSYVKHRVQRAISHLDRKLSPTVDKFNKAIQGDPVMKDLFNQIFLQVSPKNQVKDFVVLLQILDDILRSAPPYHVRTDANGNKTGQPIGVPIYAFFDLFSNTSAGYDLFRLPKFNVALKDLLDSWGKYLADDTRDSNAVLNTSDEGWFSQTAITSLETNLGGLTFDQTFYTPDPNADNRGYATWDEFFTRKFQDGRRPVDFADNQTLIHSACESTVYRIAYNVKAHDQFWLKTQNYSLYDMLNRDTEMVNYFVNGTVYQAFLSPLDYHRWHSPIDGVVKKVVIIPGTYYAALPDEGALSDDPDLPVHSPYGAIIRSQAFLTVAATRVLIYIKADNVDIGTVCFIGVGMVEVSTCQVTVTKEQAVKVGQEIGMFHFGGSSHALLFGPDCNIAFAREARVDKHVWVNSIIGQVVP